MTPTIDVIIQTAEAKLFEGKVQSISSMNEAGPFDILPYHENFISLIQTQVTLIKENGESHVITLQSTGIIRAVSNKVVVFCN